MKIYISIEDPPPPLTEQLPSTPLLGASKSIEGSPYWSKHKVSFNWSHFFLDIKISQPYDKKRLRGWGEVKANLILWLMETLVIYQEDNTVFLVWPWSTHTYDFKTTLVVFNKAENTEGLPTSHLLSFNMTWKNASLGPDPSQWKVIPIQGKKLKNKLSLPNFIQHLLFLIITFSHLLLGSVAKTFNLIKVLNKKCGRSTLKDSVTFKAIILQFSGSESLNLTQTEV